MSLNSKENSGAVFLWKRFLSQGKEGPLSVGKLYLAFCWFHLWENYKYNDGNDEKARKNNGQVCLKQKSVATQSMLSVRVLDLKTCVFILHSIAFLIYFSYLLLLDLRLKRRNESVFASGNNKVGWCAVNCISLSRSRLSLLICVYINVAEFDQPSQESR